MGNWEEARAYIEEGKTENFLKIGQLKNGYLYRIHARNAKYGIWQAEEGGFIIARTKFGRIYLFTEYHHDFSDTFGTVKPLEEIEKPPFDMVGVNDTDDTPKNNMVLEYLKKFEVLPYRT